MIKRFQPRAVLLFIALFCGGLLAFAFYLTWVVALIPCPLCIVQRFFYLLVGIAALGGFFRWPMALSERGVGWPIACLSTMGGAVAARHVWLQHFPPVSDPTKCHVSFGSFFDSVIVALGGTGSCVLVQWRFLSLSIPEWSLLCFLLLLAVGFFLAFQSHFQKDVEESVAP